MEERLKRLKKAVEQTAFSKAEFTAAHQQQVYKQLQSLPLKQTILSMLTEGKSGVQLTQMLHVPGVQQIMDNEGLVYAILHEAEQNGWLTTSWKHGVKYYQLTRLGKKQLQQDDVPVKLSIKERLLGGRMHVE